MCFNKFYINHRTSFFRPNLKEKTYFTSANKKLSTEVIQLLRHGKITLF